MRRLRVLLVNPPVYDAKLHWTRWQEPHHLYRIATYFRERGADVRYLDALAGRARGALPRLLAGRFVFDEIPVLQWRYGVRPAQIRRALRALHNEKWHPDRVVVECALPAWWQGAREMFELVRSAFPATIVHIIGGIADVAAAVPGFLPESAQSDLAVTSPSCPPRVSASAPDWDLWRDDVAHLGARDRGHTRTAPAIAFLSAAEPEVVGAEAERAVCAGIRSFALERIGVLIPPSRLRPMLENIARLKQRISLTVIGNLSAPALLAAAVDDPELLPLMRRVGIRQVFFADDRHSPVAGAAATDAAEQLVLSYRALMPRLKAAGYALRSDAVNAGMSLGRAHEDLAARAVLATRLTHAAGALVVWPYEPSYSECIAHGATNKLELQIGKLFPLRHTSGATHRDMLDICGLSVILNSKHREFTFDFGGAGFIARLFRDSLRRRAWEASDDIKGTLRLPAPPPRDFGTQSVEHAAAGVT